MPIMPQALNKILVVRNDKLGDFTLSLPVFVLLKAALPDCRLTALVPEYTRPIAAMCPAIDDILDDPGSSASRASQQALLNRIRAAQFDAVITLFSTTRVGLLVWRAQIPVRYAPATKLAQLFYNRRLRQRRSHSHQPESEYNLDLARELLREFSIANPPTPSPPYLRVDSSEIAQLRNAFCQQQQIDPDTRLVFLHPGHGGSANNLSGKQFAELANRIRYPGPLAIVVSAGPAEIEQARYVAGSISTHPVCLYESTQGLTRFAQHIAFADLFISGSTGPLHVAGALNRPTCGFYTNRRSATSLRWQTLSEPDRRLAFSPPLEAESEDMSQVDLATAAQAISNLLTRLYP